jgi:glyoxylase-like metal-dependent hydrolase (beta-lactamase superfamily II)
MRDFKKYWQEVNAIQRSLDPFVWLAPAHGPAPLVEVKASMAAKLLHSGSHRLATEEELEAHRAQETSRRQRSFHDDLRRKGIAVVPLP